MFVKDDNIKIIHTIEEIKMYDKGKHKTLFISFDKKKRNDTFNSIAENYQLFQRVDRTIDFKKIMERVKHKDGKQLDTIETFVLLNNESLLESEL